MSVTALHELLSGHAQIMPLTVEQYEQMIAAGILPEGEPYELLDGFVVRKDRSASGEDPMTVGHEHVWVIQKLQKLSAKLEKLGCHLRTQSPVSLPPYNEPEPDGSIAVGTADDYRSKHPGASDLTCVIEVADSSLRRDRTTKLRVYAKSAIAQYVIINLPDRVVEVYTNPLASQGRYGESTTLRPGRSVEFAAARGKKLSVSVKSLVP
jgi:Uma2 family endonuclease